MTGNLHRMHWIFMQDICLNLLIGKFTRQFKSTNWTTGIFLEITRRPCTLIKVYGMYARQNLSGREMLKKRDYEWSALNIFLNNE